MPFYTDILPESIELFASKNGTVLAELNPNAITGLGSKLNTREIIDRFMAIEQRRIKPVEDRKEQKGRLGMPSKWN